MTTDTQAELEGLREQLQRALMTSGNPNDIAGTEVVDELIAAAKTVGAEEMRDLVESLAIQCGYWKTADGAERVSTMGLSDLEEAFEVLGWTDPMVPDGKGGWRKKE